MQLSIYPRTHQGIIPTEVLKEQNKEVQVEKFKLLMLLILLSVSS